MRLKLLCYSSVSLVAVLAGSANAQSIAGTGSSTMSAAGQTNPAIAQSNTGTVSAPASDTNVDAGQAASETAGGADTGDIVVTGVTQKTKKIESTISTSTISQQDLKLLAANGTAQLLANIPGFLPEGGTAGESHNNVQVRGLHKLAAIATCPI